MKKIIGLSVVIALIYSCGNENANEKNDSVKKEDSLVEVVAYHDTITFSIEAIDEKYYCKQTMLSGFCKVQELYTIDSLAEQKLIKANKELVEINGNDLVLKTKNGDIKFTNKPDHNSENFIEYHLSEVNDKFITLIIYYYESFEYMVVNSETGKSFKTWGLPVFNKEKTMAIVGNFDLMAGFTNNGIQLFAQDSIGWNLKAQWIIDDWGPGYLAWMNDSVILSKKFVIDQTDSVDGVRTEFMKINLRKERLN